MEDKVSKTQLISEFQAEWLLLERLLSGLSEAQLTTPGVEADWTIKDILAHLVAWEKVLLDRLNAVMTGQPLQYPRILNNVDVDRFNAQVYQATQGRPLASVILEFRTIYTGVLTVLEAMDDEFYHKSIFADWAEEDLKVWMIVRANTGDHYQEHRLAIERWLKSPP